jgi:DNA-binding XRE family transcriptional regulator
MVMSYKQTIYKLIWTINGSTMPKKTRPQSRYAKAAATLLGQLIRKARIDRKMTAEEVADRAGLSRGLLRRIENGDPGCTIGAVFETATVVGVPLFNADETTIGDTLASNTAVMALIPKTVHASRTKLNDNF